MGGHVLFYQPLARRLGRAGVSPSVYGLKARGLEGDGEPFATVEAMAGAYVEAVRGVAPHGPYSLAGSSMGGTIAYEMAQRLVAMGETVAFLGLLDTGGPGQMPKRVEGAEAVLAALTRDSLPPEVQARSVEEQLQWMVEQAQEQGDLPEGLTLEHAHRLLRVIEGHLRAFFAYQPQPYPGRLHFFRAQERGAMDPSHPELPWIDLATGGVEVHTVPGDHITMHHPPHLEVLVEKLGRVLLRSGEGG